MNGSRIERKPLVMDVRSRRHRGWLRIVASGLVITFLNQDIAWAQDSFARNVNASVVLPAHAATVRDSWSPLSRSTNHDPRSTIFNIQDAHAYLGAQDSIVSVLETLSSDYDLRVVAIEGSSGYIDTSLLKTFPDEKVRDATARSLMEEGRMSAGEFFSITSGKKVALYGVEDDPLYRANVDEFRRLHALGEAHRLDIDRLLADLRRLADRVFPADLLAVDRALAQYRRGQLPFKRIWESLKAAGEKAGVTPGAYPNLSKLVDLTADEEGIDFGRGNAEREALIARLTETLSGDLLRQFARDTLAFKRGATSRAAYHAMLMRLARETGIDPDPYRELAAYTAYITSYESIDIVSIYDEMEEYAAAVKAALFVSDDQRELDRYLRCADGMCRLLGMALKSEELDACAALCDAFSASACAAFMGRLAGEHGVSLAGGYDIAAACARLPEAIGFYRTAERRNRAMLANTVRRMRAEGEHAAALITGGYHTAGLTALMKKEGLSYLVILPTFDPAEGERPYVAILTNKKKPYEPLLASGEYYLAAGAYFRSDPSLSERERFDAYAARLRKALYEAVAGHDTEEAKEAAMRDLIGLWAANYRTLYDEFQADQARRVAAGLDPIDFTPQDPATMERYLEELAGYSRAIRRVADAVKGPADTPETRLTGMLRAYERSSPDKHKRDAAFLEPVTDEVYAAHGMLMADQAAAFRDLVAEARAGTADISAAFDWLAAETPIGLLDIADTWRPADTGPHGDGSWYKFQTPDRMLPGEMTRLLHMRNMIAAGQAILRGESSFFTASMYEKVFGGNPGGRIMLRGMDDPGAIAERLEPFSASRLPATMRHLAYLALLLHDYGRLLKDNKKIDITKEGDPYRLREDRTQHRVAGTYLAGDLLARLGYSSFEIETVKLLILTHDAAWCLYCLDKYNDFNNETTFDSLKADVDRVAAGLAAARALPEGLTEEAYRDAIYRMAAATGIADVYASGDRHLSGEFLDFVKGHFDRPVFETARAAIERMPDEFANLTTLDEGSLARQRQWFTADQDGVYRAARFTDPFRTAVAFIREEAARDRLSEIADDVIAAAGGVAPVYKAVPAAYHVSVAFLVDGRRRPQPNVRTVRALYGLIRDLAAGQRAVTLRFRGVRCRPDGGIIAVWDDAGAIEWFSKKYASRAAGIDPHFAGDSGRPFVHTTLGRILGQVDKAQIDALSEAAARYEGMELTVTLKDLTLITERVALLEGYDEDETVAFGASLTAANRAVFDDKTALLPPDGPLEETLDGIVTAQTDDRLPPLKGGIGYWEGAAGEAASGAGESAGPRLFKIFNAGRDVSLRESPGQAAQRACLLCASCRRAVGPLGFRIGKDWEAKVNKYPIFRRSHGILIHRDHRPQRLDEGLMREVLGWVSEAPRYTFIFNGQEAGASIPGHLHIQFYRNFEPFTAVGGRSPIEEWAADPAHLEGPLAERDGVVTHALRGYPSPDREIAVLRLTGRAEDPDALAREAARVIDILDAEDVRSNVLWSRNGDEIHTYIFPRLVNQLGPAANALTRTAAATKDYILCKDASGARTRPQDSATVEMSGVFVTVDKEQYERMTRDDIATVLFQLGVPRDSDIWGRIAEGIRGGRSFTVLTAQERYDRVAAVAGGRGLGFARTGAALIADELARHADDGLLPRFAAPDVLAGSPRILLIAPYYKKDRPKPGSFLAPPLGIWRLANFLGIFGVSAEVFDPNLDGVEALEARVRGGGYDIIGFSTYDPTLANDVALAARLKELAPAATFIAGGEGAHYNRDTLLARDAPFEILYRGFGEFSLLDTAVLFLRHGRIPLDDAGAMASIGSVIYRPSAGERVHTPLAPALSRDEYRALSLTVDSASVPHERYWGYMADVRGPRRDFVPDAVSDDAIHAVRVITSSHCPRGCAFCVFSGFLADAARGKRQPVLALSAPEIIRTLRSVQAAHPGVKTIFFNDENFMFDRERIMALCELLIAERRAGRLRLNFIALGRIDDVDTGMLTQMRNAGFTQLNYGIEHFSDSVLKDMNKHLTAATARELLDATLAAGITPLINLILFYPTVTMDDVFTTIETSLAYAERGAGLAYWPYVEGFRGAPIMAKVDAGIYELSADGKNILPVDPDVRRLAGEAVSAKAGIVADIKRRNGIPDDHPLPHVVDVLAFFAAVYRAADRDASRIEGLIARLMHDERIAAQSTYWLAKMGITELLPTRENLDRILASPHPGQVLRIIRNRGLLGALVPSLATLAGVFQGYRWHEEGDALEHTLNLFNHLPFSGFEAGEIFLLKLATLFHDIAKGLPVSTTVGEDGNVTFGDAEGRGHDYYGAIESRRILTELGYDRTIVDDVAWLIGNHMALGYLEGWGGDPLTLQEKTGLVHHKRYPLLKELIRMDLSTGLAVTWEHDTLRLFDRVEEEVVRERLATASEEERARIARELGERAPSYAWGVLTDLGRSETSAAVQAAVNAGMQDVLAATFRGLDRLDPAKVEKMRTMFVTDGTGAYRTVAVPGTLALLTDWFSGESRRFLQDLADDIAGALPAGTPVYRIHPDTYHISCAVLQEKAGGFEDNDLTMEERAALEEIVSRIAAETGPITLRFRGVRAGEDGGIIAVWEDDGAIELLRRRYFEKGLAVTDKIEKARPKLFLYSTIARILGDLDPAAMEALKAAVERHAAPAGQEVTVTALRLIHETRWLGEEYETVRMFPLRGHGAITRLDRPARVALVMPMYNEMRRLMPPSADNPLGEDALRRKVEGLQRLHRANPLFAWRLIAVDDGTKEPPYGSAAMVKKLWHEIRAEYAARGETLDEDLVQVVPEVLPAGEGFEMPRKEGKKGGAVRAGMEKALGMADVDYIGYTDTDVSIDTVQIADLLAPIAAGEADAAIASRWCAGADIQSLSPMGRLQSRGYNYIVRTFLFPLRHITDTQRGFKLFTRDAAETILGRATSKGLAFDTEFLLLVKLAGGRIAEIPITWVDSAEARTFNGLLESVKMVLQVLWQARHIPLHYAGILWRGDLASARFARVVGGTLLGAAVVAGVYFLGGFDAYIALKTAIPAGAVVFWPAAIADMVTGILIWGTADAIGQYLNRGRGVSAKQSLVVGSFGIFQGFATHVLFNILDLLPVIPFGPAQMVLRTGVALTGGLIISVVFARATSLARRLTGVADYRETEELKKTGDVVLAKTALAPVKTFVVVNLLPQPVRVVSEQAWDYLMTIVAAYLMNRGESLFAKRLLAFLPSRGRNAQAQPVLHSTLERLALGDAGVVLGAVLLYWCGAGRAWHIATGLVAGLSAAALAVHMVTALYIASVCRANRIDLTGPTGKELPVAHFNTLTKTIEYLHVNRANHADLTYTPTVDVHHYVPIIDLPGGMPGTRRIAHAFIRLHEEAHMGGSTEIAAYLFPFWGALRAFRQRREIVRDVIGSLSTHTSLSNVAIDAIVGRDPQTADLLVRELERLTRLPVTPTLAARAYLLLGSLHSRKDDVDTETMETYEKQAMKVIRDSMRRTLKRPSAPLRIPAGLRDTDIIVSSSVRVDLCHGGASDLYAMSSELGGRAVNIAVDLEGAPPVRTVVRRIEEPVIRIRSIDLDIEETFDCLQDIADYTDHDDPLRLFKAACIVSGLVDPDSGLTLEETLRSLGGGIELISHVRLPTGSGLGVSSILEACVLEGLYRISGQSRSRAELIDAILYLEQMLDVGGGWQDPIGGIYGGVKYVSSPAGIPMPVSETIPVSEAFRREIEDRFVLYYTGASHFAGDILEKLVIDFISRSEKEYESRRHLMRLDLEIRKAVEAEDMETLARLLTRFWEEWKALIPETSNDAVEELFGSVSDLVSGGKLCGAGGGGFALFVAKEGKREELEERLARRAAESGTTARLFTGRVNPSGMTVSFAPTGYAAELVCGIPDGAMAPEAVTALDAAVREQFPERSVVVTSVPDRHPGDRALTALVKDASAWRGLVLDLSYGEALTVLTRHLSGDRALGVPDGYHGAVVVDPVTLESGKRDELRAAIMSLAASLPLVAPSSIEQQAALRDLLARRTAALGSLTPFETSTVPAVSATGDHASAVSITTQGILASGMLFSLRDKIAARWERAAITEKATDPLREFVLITDPSMSREEAEKYLAAFDLTGYVTLVMPGDLRATLADLSAHGITTVGIRSREGEIPDYEKALGDLTGAAIKLELAAVNGTYIDTNSYEALIELLTQTGEEREIPGVSKDKKRNIFRYIPPAIPLDYEEEVRAHREAAELFMRSA